MEKDKLAAILKAAENSTIGMLLIGKVLDARAVPGGKDRKSGEVYDGYKSATVMTSEGSSIKVKLVDGIADDPFNGGEGKKPLPVAGKVGVFLLERVWKGASGTGAESAVFVQ